MSVGQILAGLALLAGLGLAGAAWAGADGQKIYADDCAACHQATGLGRPPVFPALKDDKVVLGPKAAVLAVILNGRGGMPPWKARLTDADVAAVTTYIRAAWGGKAAPVTASDVAAARAR